jgi:hypothetical protein
MGISKSLNILLGVLMLCSPTSCQNEFKNEGAVAKRRARSDAKQKFEEENSASFDAYGRVIRYGSTADEIKCDEKDSKDGTTKYICKVTESTRRKYLTKEESITSKQMVKK